MGAEGDPEAKLYVILGSHACRTAMLMLEHKAIAYRIVELPPGMHPMALRLAGFSGSRHPIRTVDGRRPVVVGVGERLGTVPALLLGSQQVQSNRAIARFLEDLRPDPPLFPRQEPARQLVEEIEGWGDEALQMTARRLALCATVSGRLREDGQRGRLGALLFRRRRARRLAVGLFSYGFSARPSAERALLAQAREHLDDVDGWIAQGALNGESLLVADFVVAPSLALLDYHAELHEEIGERPARQLLDRLLPA
jgi:glutathione S-transferase